MGKNILVVTGSPRKNGNSEMLADAFIKGAQSQGHVVSKFEAALKKIGGCTACDQCWSKGNACVIEDDFRQLEPLLEKADILVVAFPLYWYSFPAQIKAFIDRLYAYVSPKTARPLKIKQTYKLVSAADFDESALIGLKQSCKSICTLMKWESVNSIYAVNINKKGEIAKTDFLKEAEEMGKAVGN